MIFNREGLHLTRTGKKPTDSPYLKGFKLKLEGEGDDVLVDNSNHKPQFNQMLKKK